MKSTNIYLSNKNFGKKLDKGINNAGSFNIKKVDKNQNENLGNENLYKNDTYYNMAKNLSFDTTLVENSFTTGVFVRNLDIIKITIYFHIFITALKIYYELSDIHWFISILRILISTIVFSISKAILNLNKLEINSYIRWFIEIDIVVNILIKTNCNYSNTIIHEFLNYTDNTKTKYNINSSIFVNENNFMSLAGEIKQTSKKFK